VKMLVHRAVSKIRKEGISSSLNADNIKWSIYWKSLQIQNEDRLYQL
jgi:hypothetical protein